MGMDDDTRLGLCSDCGYKIAFMASVEGEEGRCPKCGSPQLLIPYSKTPTNTTFTEKREAELETPEELLRQMRDNTAETISLLKMIRWSIVAAFFGVMGFLWAIIVKL